MDKKLKEELLRIVINEFGNQLTNYEYNQYVTKLRDYFVEYLVSTKSNCKSIEEIFKYEFTRNDIIESTLYYITENQNVTRKSAIDDFLTSLNAIFDETINKKYFNQNIVNIKPFNSLSSEVERILEQRGVKSLQEREAYPPISVQEYNFISNYFTNYNPKKLNEYQYKIICNLLLLYGFSFDRIINLKIDDYSEKKGTLSILYDKDKKRYLELELPYNLKILFDEFIIIRKNHNINLDLMFISNNYEKITHSYLVYTFNTIKKKLYKAKNISNNDNARNSFTTTGLAKYAVIQMILQGMNQSIILDLTGFKDEHYNDCQNRVNELKNLNRNRYINHMIRGISTYDDV